MIPSWEKDPFGFFLSIMIIGFAFAVAYTFAAAIGADFEDADEMPEETDVHWWLTEGPQFYPGTFTAGAFLLMLFAFKVYMHVG